MKRLLIYLLVICLLPIYALATDVKTLEYEGQEFLLYRQKVENNQNNMKFVLEMPLFEGANSSLVEFLNDTISVPFSNLTQNIKSDETSTDNATIANFTFSTNINNLFFLEGSVISSLSKDSTPNTQFFYAMVDLENRKTIDIFDLFNDEQNTISLNIATTALNYANKQGLTPLVDLTNATTVSPISYLPTKDYLRVFYNANTLCKEVAILDLPYTDLMLLPSSYLLGKGATQPTNTATSTPVATPTKTATPTKAATPNVTSEPTPAPSLTPQPLEINTNFTLSPVITPTPMPLQASDVIISDVLLNGLWKPLGEDNTEYYQFTQDGKLLTITVSDYSLIDGVITSDTINGLIDIGSESAFTLRNEGENPVGYVLNRQGDSVAPAEFVTPSPTPVPTPTPTPSPTPSPTPVPTPTPSPTPTPTPVPTVTPTPSPVPTPTLSPYELAHSQAQLITTNSDAYFEKARSLDVYSAPSSDAYKDEGASVTTNSDVNIYGSVGDWVLVGYNIRGSKGRIGYVKNSVDVNIKNSPELTFSSVSVPLTKDTQLTDDPLFSTRALCDLKKGDNVIVLAFMQGNWAYVESTYKNKQIRGFVQQSCLMEE